MADRPRGGGTIRLSNLRIERRYLDPDYELVYHDLERGANGSPQSVFSNAQCHCKGGISFACGRWYSEEA